MDRFSTCYLGGKLGGFHARHKFGYRLHVNFSSVFWDLCTFPLDPGETFSNFRFLSQSCSKTQSCTIHARRHKKTSGTRVVVRVATSTSEKDNLAVLFDFPVHKLPTSFVRKFFQCP